MDNLKKILVLLAGGLAVASLIVGNGVLVAVAVVLICVVMLV